MTSDLHRSFAALTLVHWGCVVQRGKEQFQLVASPLRGSKDTNDPVSHTLAPHSCLPSWCSQTCPSYISKNASFIANLNLFCAHLQPWCSSQRQCHNPVSSPSWALPSWYSSHLIYRNQAVSTVDAWIKRESIHGFLIILINEDEDVQNKEGQVQKINSSVKIFINKGQGCAEKRGGRWEGTQHPFFPFFVIKNCDSTAQISSSVLLWASARPAMTWHTGSQAKHQV